MTFVAAATAREPVTLAVSSTLPPQPPDGQLIETGTVAPDVAGVASGATVDGPCFGGGSVPVRSPKQIRSMWTWIGAFVVLSSLNERRLICGSLPIMCTPGGRL